LHIARLATIYELSPAMENVMRATIIGLVSAGLLASLGGTSQAHPSKAQRSAKSHSHNYKGNSPSAIAERQRHARTFDETEYYEHDSRKIPAGTLTWWNQLDRESGDRR
jgi:hypothetical protein